jgi:hypothetical protein
MFFSTINFFSLLRHLLECLDIICTDFVYLKKLVKIRHIVKKAFTLAFTHDEVRQFSGNLRPVENTSLGPTQWQNCGILHHQTGAYFRHAFEIFKGTTKTNFRKKCFSEKRCRK